MAAEGGIPDRSRGWGSQADQGKRSKIWGQAEPLCSPLQPKSDRRLSRQLKDGENATFLSVESRIPWLGGHRTERSICWGREALGNWGGRLAAGELDGGLMLRVLVVSE